MVAPLSQSSNNSTGMSGYTSACGSDASTSAYVGTQQLAVLPGCSSSGMGEIQKSTGSTKFGGSATYTLGADVDVHSEIHYTYSLPTPDTSGTPTIVWKYMVGLHIIKDVTIKVGTSEWEKIDQASMLAMAQLEMTTAEYDQWCIGLSGLDNEPSAVTSAEPGTPTSPAGGYTVRGGKLMCCVKGGYRGQLFVAAMPYQSVTVKINFSTAAACSAPTTTAFGNNFDFALYTKQHILSPYERGLMQSTDILQLLSTTQYYTTKIPSGTSVTLDAINLSFLDEYCTHVAVWVSENSKTNLGGGVGAGAVGDSLPLLDKCEFIYNGTSAQGQQRSPILVNSNMTGLAMGGVGPKYVAGVIKQNPNIQVFQLANTPCVTSLSTSHSQFAPFAGGDGVANNRYDVIQFKANITTAAASPSAWNIHFVAFGAQSVLYSAGGAIKN